MCSGHRRLACYPRSQGRVSDFFAVLGLGLGIPLKGSRRGPIKGSMGFRVQGLGFRVSGLTPWALGFGFKATVGL